MSHSFHCLVRYGITLHELGELVHNYKHILVPIVTSGERTQYISITTRSNGGPTINVFGQWPGSSLDRVFLCTILGTLPYPISYTLLIPTQQKCAATLGSVFFTPRCPEVTASWSGLLSESYSEAP